MERKKIIWATAIPRDALSGKVNKQEKKNKITFNIIYYQVFWGVRKILEELHVILASDDEHKKVFLDIPLIDFKNNKNLKTHLVRWQLPELDEVGRFKPCGGKRRPCHLYENIKDICTFKSKHLVRYIKSTRSIIVTQKWQFIWLNARYVVNNILGVQKQSLGLGQITKKVRSKALLKKRQFQSKPWNKNVFNNIKTVKEERVVPDI